MKPGIRVRGALVLALLSIAIQACSQTAAPAVSARAGASPRAGAPPIAGEALAIQDGDSFVMRAADGTRLTVRIAGIDAPEKGQPWADVSRRHLAGLLRGAALVVMPHKTDRYARIVGDVSADGEDAGLRQLHAGLAWHFRRYAAEQAPRMRRDYAAAEDQARERRIGLWADPNPVAPWAHREASRAARQQPRIAGSSSPALP